MESGLNIDRKKSSPRNQGEILFQKLSDLIQWEFNLSRKTRDFLFGAEEADAGAFSHSIKGKLRYLAQHRNSGTAL